MKKDEFLEELRKNLRGLPKDDVEDRVNFYSEMIDDKISDGSTEEEAVASIDMYDVVKDVAEKTPLVSLVKEKVKPKRKIRPWEIVLLILGFPLWFPLMLTLMILLLVAILVVWILVIASYAVEVGLFGGSILSLVVFFGYMGEGEFNLFPLGASFLATGAAMIFLLVCILSTKITVKLSKKILVGIKMMFIGKGDK